MFHPRSRRCRNSFRYEGWLTQSLQLCIIISAQGPEETGVKYARNCRRPPCATVNPELMKICDMRPSLTPAKLQGSPRLSGPLPHSCVSIFRAIAQQERTTTHPTQQLSLAVPLWCDKGWQTCATVLHWPSRPLPRGSRMAFRRDRRNPPTSV